MRRWLCTGALFVGILTSQAAEERFSSAVRAEDFTAAGLAKLSPGELARLDQLVRDYKSGALEAAQREAALAQAKADKAEAHARAAEAAAKARASETAAKPAPSLLARAQVLLTPGTKIEYSTLDSRLVGDFVGWERNTVFTLANGQRWRATSTSAYVTPPMPAPKVRIVPGALGAFWLEIEGVRQRVKVESLDAR